MASSDGSGGVVMAVAAKTPGRWAWLETSDGGSVAVKAVTHPLFDKPIAVRIYLFRRERGRGSVKLTVPA